MPRLIVALLLAWSTAADGQSISVGLKLTRARRPAGQDAIQAAGPLAYWHADDGYRTDGALRIGKVRSAFTPNYVTSTSTDFRTGSAASWSICCAANFLAGSPAIETPAVQTIAAKRGANQHEFRLVRDAAGTISLTVYDAAGSSSLTVTSVATVAAGTTAQICCGYDHANTRIFLKLDAAATVTSAALGFTVPAAGTAALRLGSDGSVALPGYLDLDSYGWFKGHALSEGEMTALNAGARFEDLSAELETAVTQSGCAWFDFGNATLDPTVEDRWDWLEDSNANAHSLTQAQNGSEGYPHMVPGLIAPAATASSTGGPVRWLPDRSGNGRYAINHWPKKVRIGYAPTGWSDGTACYWCDGTRQSGDPRMSGRFIYSTECASAFTGKTQQPWSGVWVVKLASAYRFGSEPTDPEQSYFGMSLGGPGEMGYLPWGGWATSTAGGQAHHTVTFMSGTRADNISPFPYHHWYSERQDSLSNQRCFKQGNYNHCLDTADTVFAFTFDGATSTLKANGVEVFSFAQTANTHGGTDAIGNQTINAWFLNSFAAHTDTFGGFSGSGVRFWGGNDAIYGAVKAIAVWDRALTADELEAIQDEFVPSPTIGPAYKFPVRSTNLYKWYTTNTFGPFVERSSAVTRATTNGDLVGTWRARNNGVSYTIPWTASADGSRGTIAADGGIYLDGVAGKNLQAALALSQPFTVMLVAKPVRNSGTSSWYEWIYRCPSTNHETYTYGTTVALYGGTGSELVSSTTNYSVPRVYTFVANGAASKIRIDGTQAASGTISAGNLATLTNLYYDAASHQGKGYIYELIAWSEAMSDSNMALEEARLKSIWGTP